MDSRTSHKEGRFYVPGTTCYSVTRTNGMRQHRVADTEQGNTIYPRRIKLY
jgi:hypothetical protein